MDPGAVVPSGRIEAYLVCGGSYHDTDFARLQLLTLLAEDERVRVRVAATYEDVHEISTSDLLVSYTCDVRPSRPAQRGLRAWVEEGGRWLALHGTGLVLDPPDDVEGVFETPRAFPILADTLGSQLLAHPPPAPYQVRVSPGAEDDPLVAGVAPFEAHGELYLCEYHGDVVPLLETRWTGRTPGFAEADWPDDEPRLVMYRRPLGAGEVVYLTLGHCRGRYDRLDLPLSAVQPPTVDRHEWELPAFRELLRRGLAWAAEPARRRLEGVAGL